MTEEHKQALKEGREKKKLEKASTKGLEKGFEFVKKEEFDHLINMVSTIARSVQELKTVQQTPAQTVPVVKDEEPDKTHLPPKWRELCDQVLGKDFGLNVTYPDTGKGFLIKVIVPRDKSNAPVSHWEFYKADIRSKAIGFGEGLDGVKAFYEKVRNNLKLNQANILK